ncbi:ImuA family protein [Roseibium sp.]|uniref:ImuA family protein n=1 Tax=Roseibium sp. TaxID=1936156 RepID=UPI003A976673
MVNPVGLSAFLDPACLLLVQTRNQTETLSVSEEALKAGAVPLVIFEISRPLDLREGRRLQLTARAGSTTGLGLIPEGQGNNAAETRWHCAPVFDVNDSTLMRWEIIKNKTGTLGAWHVRWNAETHHLDVVSPACKRPGSADTPD